MYQSLLPLLSAFPLLSLYLSQSHFFINIIFLACTDMFHVRKFLFFFVCIYLCVYYIAEKGVLGVTGSCYKGLREREGNDKNGEKKRKKMRKRERELK